MPSINLLTERDELRLQGVDTRLVAVVRLALARLPFQAMVVEGRRTRERQAELYAQGRTKPGKKVTWTLNSKHIEGKAVDLAPIERGVVLWNDAKKFDALRLAMMASAAELNVGIRSGADWDGDGKPHEKGETDSPHFELT